MAYTDYSSPSGNFGPLFYAADQKYGFRPGTMGALSYVESHYNPKAVSPQGAQGLTQLMPDTARGLGVSNPFDPAQSVDGGARYFKQGLDAEGGDYTKAAMYYHGGPNTDIWGPKTHSYADNFMARLTAVNPQAANPYTAPPQTPQAPQMPQDGGPPPMPPPAPATLGALAKNPNLNAQVDPSLYGSEGAPMNPASLGALANGPAKPPSKFTAGNILGTLGDALSAYGGRQPTFGPFLQQEKVLQQQQDFEREKFNQELQMRMYAMLHPEAFMQAQVFNAMPPDQQHNFLSYKDATDPINVSTPLGTQNVQRTATKTVNGQTFFRVGNDWYQAGGGQ